MQAVLDRAHDAIVGVVEHGIERQHRREHAAVDALGRVLRLQQPADLGGEHDVVALVAAQRLADAMLAPAMAVERRGIDEAHTGVEGRLHRIMRIGIADRRIEVAERGGAEAEDRHLQLGAAERPLVRRLHDHSAARVSGMRSGGAGGDS